ncbi:hypothetical protein [Exiguobacterium sp. LL15]|uniref:hypothetical protein n=1 Tax=Exiguobacterium sp. LL15 TaxID=2950547 RepID=UPI00210BE271|nr:hypothetical protein [Exiguobacterium sp. LL15]MCQ4091693.1 hypothetical protein [Exiguobacterium sp. LL15]
MYKNRSPNTFIIFMILFATSFSIPHSHATTDELEIPDPLTSSFCEETLNDPTKEDLLKKEERIQCEELLELEQTTPPESENPLTSETTPPESENPLTSETTPPESENPLTSETTPPESEDPPTSETTPPESEDPPTSETSSTEEDETIVIEQPQSDDNEESTPNSETSKSDKGKNTAVPNLLSISLLGTSSLSASYQEVQIENDGTRKTIELTNRFSAFLGLGLSNKQYIVFIIPPSIMDKIKAESVYLEYSKSGNIVKKESVTIDKTNNLIYWNTSSIISVGLLGLLNNIEYKLVFEINNLPINSTNQYTFKSAVIDEAIDLNILSNSTASADLMIGSTLRLTTPTTLNFGSHELTGREKIIPRVSPMTIAISHENATGYNWKLQASLSRPLTSTTGDVLTDVLYFKTASKTQLLQTTAIEVATGTMSASSNQTPLTYAENEGIVLDLTGKYPKPLSYSADIQWSLVDAP